MSSPLFNINAIAPVKPLGGLNGTNLKAVPAAQGCTGAVQPMSSEEFSDFRDFIYKQSGIYFVESKKYLLEGRIQKRLAANYLSTYREYLRLIKSASGKPEIISLIDSITVNETYFFRAEQHYEALVQEVIPNILKSRNGLLSQTINIWSAASSTGEEPYTLAMLLHDKLLTRYPNIRFNIVGSDISNSCLETARRGIYKDYSLKITPDYYIKKYFKVIEGNYHLNDSIKKMVKFVSINLYDDATMKTMRYSDVIICANVLIYFDNNSKEKVVANLYDLLNKGGYLFIGNSESLHGVTKAFRLVHFHKAMAYYKE